MSIPPRGAGRQVTLAGLRVILLMFAGFLAAAMLFAALGQGLFETRDESLNAALLPVLGLLALAEGLTWFVLRLRMQPRWKAELAVEPYRPGGPVPTNYAGILIIGGAFAEGIGVFGALIHLMTGDFVALVVSGIALLLILAQLPREEALR